MPFCTDLDSSERYIAHGCSRGQQKAGPPCILGVGDVSGSRHSPSKVAVQWCLGRIVVWVAPLYVEAQDAITSTKQGEQMYILLAWFIGMAALIWLGGRSARRDRLTRPSEVEARKVLDKA